MQWWWGGISRSEPDAFGSTALVDLANQSMWSVFSVDLIWQERPTCNIAWQSVQRDKRHNIIISIHQITGYDWSPLSHKHLPYYLGLYQHHLHTTGNRRIDACLLMLSATYSW